MKDNKEHTAWFKMVFADIARSELGQTLDDSTSAYEALNIVARAIRAREKAHAEELRRWELLAQRQEREYGQKLYDLRLGTGLEIKKLKALKVAEIWNGYVKWKKLEGKGKKMAKAKKTKKTKKK